MEMPEHGMEMARLATFRGSEQVAEAHLAHFGVFLWEGHHHGLLEHIPHGTTQQLRRSLEHIYSASTWFLGRFGSFWCYKRADRASLLSSEV